MSETKTSAAQVAVTGTFSAKGYAAMQTGASLAPWNFERRNPGPHDVQIDIQFCGVCHTDLHFVRNDLGISVYPLVPGHEIVGRVTHVGNQVRRFQPGDLVGVGCLVDSCRVCDCCNEGEQQYCLNGNTYTYNGTEKETGRNTYGGYSSQIVVNEDFVLRVSEKLSPAAVAPLLCAGITTYSPLRRFKVGKGHRIGIVGLGGLGHMAVKFAASFGAEVTVLSRSANKQEDARKLGAHRFALTTDEAQVQKLASHFDFILDTVAVDHDHAPYLGMLKTKGTLICVGIAPEPVAIPMFPLIFQGRQVAGSLIGGLPQTQEMLDYCAEHNITADIELIRMQDINQAFERIERSDVKYRFVIDMTSL